MASVPTDSEIPGLLALAKPVVQRLLAEIGNPLARSLMERLMTPVLADLAVHVARAGKDQLNHEQLAKKLGLPLASLHELIAAMRAERYPRQ